MTTPDMDPEVDPHDDAGIEAEDDADFGAYDGADEEDTFSELDEEARAGRAELLADLADRVELPDAEAADEAAARQSRLTKPAGALGRLEELAEWLCSIQGRCPPKALGNVVVAIFAADHGVARTARTSAYPPEVTAQMVRNFLDGGAAVNVLARDLGVTVTVYDMGVEGNPDDLPPDVVVHRLGGMTGSLDVEDAMDVERATAAFMAGIAIAEDAADAGVDLLIPGDMGIGNTTPAAVIIGLLTGHEVAEVVGRGTGIDDATWMRKAAAVRDGMRRGRPLKAEPLELLAAVGGPDIAAMTGLLVGAAVRKTPVLLDGVVSCAAALVADRISFRARQWWLAGHLSTEPAAALALERLQLIPVIDLGLRLGEGTGALLALPVLRAAGALLSDMATLDDAGVSDRVDA